MLFVHIGSQNPQKIEAVRLAFREYNEKLDRHIRAKCIGYNVPTGVNAQPITFEETLAGAKHRAEEAFRKHDPDDDFNPRIGIGLESGVIDTPGTLTGHMDVAVCVLRSERGGGYGLSYGFEVPDEIMCLIREGLTMSEAAFKAGLTTNRDLGSSEGLIGILSKGRLNRLDQLMSAVRSALIHL